MKPEGEELGVNQHSVRSLSQFRQDHCALSKKRSEMEGKEQNGRLGKNVRINEKKGENKGQLRENTRWRRVVI